MVIVELSGGLGNQMFQFALYKKLELMQKDVAMDTSFFRSGQNLRKLELDVFHLSYKEISDQEAAHIRGYGYHDTILDKIRYKLRPSNIAVYHDTIGEYQSQIFEMDNVYLSGYWQNEKYFNDIRKEIFTCFAFPDSLEEKKKKLLEKIQNENSVGIHIRRSDYLIKENRDVYGGICTKEYYENAIEYIREHICHPVFYLFSDDLNWVRENLYREGMVLVEHSENQPSYTDMYLMSQCKHNIIANSSYSWWGAWLNSKDGKMVIAPDNWFNNHETTDMICKDWIRIGTVV